MLDVFSEIDVRHVNVGQMYLSKMPFLCISRKDGYTSKIVMDGCSVI